jgi:hypothetical protein
MLVILCDVILDALGGFVEVILCHASQGDDKRFGLCVRRPALSACCSSVEDTPCPYAQRLILELEQQDNVTLTRI